jgi:hypothetical protein
MMAESDLSQQVSEAHWAITLHSLILGDIANTPIPVGFG